VQEVDLDWSVNGDEVTDEIIQAWESIKTKVTQLAPNLYISGFPENEVVPKLDELNIGLIISTTQRMPRSISNIPMIRLPLSDDFEELPDLDKLSDVAWKAYTDIQERGTNVLVHCLYGLNRSSLVAGFILHLLYPEWSGEEILMHIQDQRPGALHNRLFAEIVKTLK